MNPFRNPSARAYQEIGLETGIAGASPHQLVLMLFDGTLSAIADARQHLRTSNVPAKGAAISRAIRIISEGLAVSLDMEGGGPIAQQLRDLYDYMVRRLVEANLKNSEQMLAEVSALLTELRAAWCQIGERPAPQSAGAGAPVPQQERRAVSYGAA
jgi:flagellar secretion chaperone FliS